MRIINQIMEFGVNLIFYLASYFVKRDEHRIALGSWAGELYIDNTKYLLEEMLKDLDDSFIFAWVGKTELEKALPRNQRVKLLRKDSISTYFELLKCKYFFCSQYATIDLCKYNVFHGAILTYLHHGFPIKKIGADKVTHTRKTSLMLNKITLRSVYDYFVVSSEIQKQIFLSKGCTQNNILSTGTPRNDFLLRLSENEKQEIKKMFKESNNIGQDKKIILYLPTFRRLNTNIESLYNRKNSEEKGRIHNLLTKNNCILVEKGHFADHSQWKPDSAGAVNRNYLCLGKNTNVQELLVCADILISDFSGAFVDYLLLNRPIIHYLYDYDNYKEMDSGLNFTREEFACGKIAYNFPDLLSCIVVCLNGEDDEETKRITKRKLFLEYETGNASKQIINKVILNIER